MENIQLRKVTLIDIDKLQKVGRQTFEETFSSTNTNENMTCYLDEKFATNVLCSELNNSCSLFYFAECDDKIVGYLKINWGYAQTEINDKNGLEIERIYVLRKYQGKNIGQLFYEKAIEEAVQKQCDYIWLGVWEENVKAIAFYKKNGFVEFDKHIFKLGNDEQTDIMMQLELKK